LQAIPPDTLKAIHAADVVFLPSFSEYERAFLLKYAKVLVYTPSNEVSQKDICELGGNCSWANLHLSPFVADPARIQHFGIVPVEAMYAGLPVVAVNSGGPTESILHNETGLLVPPEPAAFADAIASLLSDAALREVRSPSASEYTACVRTNAFVVGCWADVHAVRTRRWAEWAASALSRSTRWPPLAPP